MNFGCILPSVIQSRVPHADRPLGPATRSTMLQTLMLSAVPNPRWAAPCTAPPRIDVLVYPQIIYNSSGLSLIHRGHDLSPPALAYRPFCFASLPFEATAVSAWDNAIMAPSCSFGCDRLMHRGKQIGLLQHIFLVTPVEPLCASLGQRRRRMSPRLNIGILMSID